MCRTLDKTTFTKFEEVKKFKMYGEVPGRPAGQIVSFFEDNLRKRLNRDETQAAFGFYFFDDACWNCGNPFHHRPDCDKERIPGLHRIARRLHEMNHPRPL